MDKRVFKATGIESRQTGWIADLSPADVINLDCYWPFRTRKAALEFIALVDAGTDASEAAYQVTQPHTSGAKPDTSLFLGGERRQWLKEQGGIQPTIHRLIDEARGRQ